MAQIEFKGVSLVFENNLIVEDFNLTVNSGEIVTFFGPSGCGKSSVMKLVLGINTPTTGFVEIQEIDASAYKFPISYVPQDNELLPWLSVKENVEVWSKKSFNHNLPSLEVLEMVGLQNHYDKLPGVLSGGMARRTVLARALATKSDILCFDEAMVGIEKTMRYKLLSTLRQYIKANNLTAVFISHDHEETIFLSDRIVVFSPPPAVISKVISVSELSNDIMRDEGFINSQIFKEIYNQML